MSLGIRFYRTFVAHVLRPFSGRPSEYRGFLVLLATVCVLTAFGEEKVYRRFRITWGDRSFDAYLVLPMYYEQYSYGWRDSTEQFLIGPQARLDSLVRITQGFDESASGKILKNLAYFPIPIGAPRIDKILDALGENHQESATALLRDAQEQARDNAQRIVSAAEAFLLKRYREKGLFRHDALGFMEKEIRREIKRVHAGDSALVYITAPDDPNDGKATLTVFSPSDPATLFAFEKRFTPPLVLAEHDSNSAQISWEPDTVWSGNAKGFSAKTLSLTKKWQNWYTGASAEIKATATNSEDFPKMFPLMIALAEANKLFTYSPRTVPVDAGNQDFRFLRYRQGMVSEILAEDKPLGVRIRHYWIEYDESEDPQDQKLGKFYRRLGFREVQRRANPLMPGSTNVIAHATRADFVENALSLLVYEQKHLDQARVKLVDGAITLSRPLNLPAGVLAVPGIFDCRRLLRGLNRPPAVP